MKLRLYDRLDGVTTLGPGVRYVIWTQGCHRRCPGCMTPASRSMDGGSEMETEELAEIVAGSGREGVTISGGEPFLQAEALNDFIDRVRSVRDLGVIIYTGCTLEQLEDLDDPHVRGLLDRCDLLVDGEYVEALNDGKSLRGSSNQRAIPLTDRYRDHLHEYGGRSARVEFFFKEDKISMVGVPSHQMLERIRNNAI